jgi:hypothetical protein
MGRRLLLLLLLLAPFVAVSDGAPIFTLQDPRGDDHGDGSLVYPLRDDLESGDLDLVQFSARAEGEGTLFEATFANPIASPVGRMVDPGGSPMESLARLGFYTFNIDLYVDTDRIPGSGETTTLPGRRALVDSTCAWEKMILLTPRPSEARKELAKRRLALATVDLEKAKPHLEKADLDSLENAVDAGLDAVAFFPTRVRVSGRRITFFVPGAFLAVPARDDWAYVVIVTAADPFSRHDVGAMLGLGARPDAGLMIVPIAQFPSRAALGGGREGDELQPPVMDLLLPEGLAQESILKDYDLRSRRPVSLPGVVPSGASTRR